MKNLRVSLILAVAIISGLHSGGVQFYGVKSAKIDYEIKGSGNAMGMGEIKTIGKKRLVFDNYGAKKLEEENKITKQVAMGKAQVSKVHTLGYVNGVVAYNVNFKKKAIMRSKNRGAILANSMSGDIVKKGEQMLKKMGGKKLGTQKVAGVNCDVWSLMGVKQCLYKGIPLKIESDIMGIKTVEVATKAEFDVSLNDSDFRLPNFDVYQLDMDQAMVGGKAQKLDKSKLEQMDKEANARADTEAKKSQEMTKEVKANGLLPTIKSKMLKQEKLIKFAQKCFKDADSLTEANICNKKANKMSEDPDMKEKPLKKWNDKVKNELLKDLEKASKAMDCVKKANNMKELGVCVK